MEFEHLDEKWAESLQQDLEQYMAELSAYLYDEDEVPEDFETLSGQPYCGCSTCEIREILALVVPRSIQGLIEGKVLVDTDKSLK
jgi:hypothetical protein